jgi:O-antigen ligase
MTTVPGPRACAILTSWKLGLADGRGVGQTHPMFVLTLVLIAASLFLGGGTQGGFLSDAILQLVAIPILCVALWRLLEVPLTRQMKAALFFVAAMVAIPLAQLIPLPPWLWSALPGREPLVETFNLLGQRLPWMPISVLPSGTWISALSLIPPIAIFIATLQLSYHDRRWLTVVFLAVGLFAVFLGLIQAAQGLESPWRFYEFTNFEEAVGFFANKNHFAALLYSLVLFSAAWLVHSAARVALQFEGRNYDAASIAAMLGAFTLVVAFLAGAAIARSRMGLLLTIVALLGALALGASGRRAGGKAFEGNLIATRLLLVAVAVGIIFSAQYALYGIMERFSKDQLDDARFAFNRNTIEAALANMPFGSGLGTFVPVYAMFEKPRDLIVNTYANHAHNDILELWLTTGVLGLPLLGMFLAWVALRSFEIWRSAPPHGADGLDWSLVRAATLAIALLVAHSFVDYPLRTGAMMAVLAFACALLIEPPPEARPWQWPWLQQLWARLQRALGMLQDWGQPELASEARSAVATPRSIPQLAEPSPDHAISAAPQSPRPVSRTDAIKIAVQDRLAAAALPTPVPALLPTPAPALPAEPSGGSSLSPERRWGPDLNWPEEWSQSPQERVPKDSPDRKR